MKLLKKIIMLVIIALTGIFFYQNSQWMLKNPKEKIELNAVAKADVGEDNQVYILNESGSEFIKVNESDQIVFDIDMSDYGTAKDLLISGDKVYIRTIDVEKGGYRIAGDRIVVFSTSGEYEDTVYENIFEEAQLVTQICGMYIINGEFTYMLNTGEQLELYSEDNRLVKEYPGSGLAKDINSIAISQDGETLYYCKLNGTIYQYQDGKDDQLIYNASEQEELSIPRSLVLDAEENLYFTDIARREVYYLKADGTTELVEEYEDGTDFYEKDICYWLSANQILCAQSEYVVKIYQEEEIRYVYELTYSGKVKAICVIEWVLLFVDAVIVLYLLKWLFAFAKKRMSKYGKMALTAVGAVSAIALVFVGIILPPFKEQLLDQMFNQAQVLSESASYVLDKEALQQITSAKDYDGEAYNSVRESMRALFLNGSDSTHDFYVQLYTIQNEDVITITFCLQEDTGAVYPYDWEFEGSDEQTILTTKEGKTYSDTESSDGSYLFVLNPIIDENGEAVGLIEVGTDLGNFQDQYMSLQWNLVINIAAITVVVVLIIIEILAYMEGREEYKKRKTEKKTTILSNGVLRILVFIIFFVTNLSTGFLPNYAMKISSDNLAIPKEILAAIPISAEVVVGAVFSIWGTYVIRFLGEKRVAILSSIGIVLGFLLRLIPNIWVLTIGNAIIGAGWGILLLMVNTMIAMKDDESEKDSGFADYSAAALNGVNCGVVFGGLLTNWFSYKIIFIISAIFSMAILIYSRKYLSLDILRNAEKEKEESKESKESISFIKFMLNGRILSYFVMIVIPVIACGYFLNYMFPILGAEYGLSDTNIGYAYLLNGICVICLSSVLTKIFSNKVDKRLSLILSVLLYAVAFLIVARYQNLYSILAALVLLGISDSFGLPIQTGYYTDLDIVKKYGYDKAIGIYSLFENGAQAGGSFIFSWVLIYGVSTGLRIVTGVIVSLAFIFLVISMIGNTKKRKEEA